MKSYLFPGQGVQFIGMGKDLFDQHVKARKMFELANKILDYEITEIMFNGPKNILDRTDITQPAIYLCSVINYLLKHKYQPYSFAGHSLGEISCLFAAGVISFEDGLKLVNMRGKLMNNDSQNKDLCMVAVLGLEDIVVESICNNFKDGVYVANYNCPGQVVISGKKILIEKVCEIAKMKGARKCIYLQVNGAFHSPFMKKSENSLKIYLDDIKFNTPKAPVYQNFDGMYTLDVDCIKNKLIKQITSPVKWHFLIKNMIKNGCDNFIDVGPSKVLLNLNKKIDKNIITEIL